MKSFLSVYPVVLVNLIYILIVSFSFPIVDGSIDWISVFTEGLLAVLTALGLFLVASYRDELTTYFQIFLGLTLLLFAFTTDTLDEFIEMPAALNMLVEGAFQDIGFLLLIYGLHLWLKYLRRTLRKVERLAVTDELTGISNRRHFFEVVGGQVEQARRHGLPLTLVMFDLDYFKQINDIHGHVKGDGALKDLAEHVSARLRMGDFFARYGGEEFLIALPNTNLKGAEKISSDLRQSIKSSISVGNSEVSASFGVAELAPGETLDALLNRVDEALYRAKENGRDKVELAH